MRAVCSVVGRRDDMLIVDVVDVGQCSMLADDDVEHGLEE